jgi:hypothetical protein
MNREYDDAMDEFILDVRDAKIEREAAPFDHEVVSDHEPEHEHEHVELDADELDIETATRLLEDMDRHWHTLTDDERELAVVPSHVVLLVRQSHPGLLGG